MSLERLICKVGISDQPFILSYKKYGDYATEGFCKPCGKNWITVNAAYSSITASSVLLENTTDG
jgi:hypothetical protein